MTLVTDVTAAPASLGVQLLVRCTHRFAKSEKDELFTVLILADLVEMEESPWGKLHGKPLERGGVGEASRPLRHQAEHRA